MSSRDQCQWTMEVAKAHFVFGTGLGVWNWLLCLADYVIQKHIIVLKSLKLSYPSLLNDF
jgi:hypothetical protein